MKPASPTIGHQLVPLERTITLVDMVAYAGATWDWHRLHYDPAFIEAARLPAPVVDGQVFGALFTEMIQLDLGPACFIRELSFSFRNLMFATETVRCTGVITEVSSDAVRVELASTILASPFGHERPAAAPASALVLVGTIDGPMA